VSRTLSKQWFSLTNADSSVTPGVNVKINGNPKLPGETVVSAGCATAVSVFSVDYDAPSKLAAPIQAHLKSIVGRTKIRGH
jgi:5'-nucleotidase